MRECKDGVVACVAVVVVVGDAEDRCLKEELTALLLVVAGVGKSVDFINISKGALQMHW